MHAGNFRVGCLRSPDGRHHWLSVTRRGPLTAPRPHFVIQFKRKVLSHADFRITCQYCLFTTRAVIDFLNEEVRVAK